MFGTDGFGTVSVGDSGSTIKQLITSLFVSVKNIFRSEVKVKETITIKLPPIERVLIKHKD